MSKARMSSSAGGRGRARDRSNKLWRGSNKKKKEIEMGWRYVARKHFTKNKMRRYVARIALRMTWTSGSSTCMCAKMTMALTLASLAAAIASANQGSLTASSTCCTVTLLQLSHMLYRNPSTTYVCGCVCVCVCDVSE